MKKVNNLKGKKTTSAVKGSSNVLQPYGKGSTAKGGQNYKKTENTVGIKGC